MVSAVFAGLLQTEMVPEFMSHALQTHHKENTTRELISVKACLEQCPLTRNQYIKIARIFLYSRRCEYRRDMNLRQNEFSQEFG